MADTPEPPIGAASVSQADHQTGKQIRPSGALCLAQSCRVEDTAA
jgi:hypothetical protein